jgi:stage V sporulation protein B
LAESKTSAGRGVVYIAFAKFYFMIVGLVIQFRLPAILSRASFGRFSMVNSIASLFNNVAVTGTIQSVSKFATQDPDKARAVQRAGLRMHLRLGLPIAIGFIASAPIVAWLLHDSNKTAPLMLAGLIIGGYSFYAVFIGTANGLHAFHKQAGLDMTFATLRATGLLGMAIAGFGVVGVIGGWVAAVGIIICVAIAWVGLPGGVTEQMSVRPLLEFFLGVAAYLLLFNALMFVDNFLLERLMAEHFAAHATDLAAAVDRALPWAPHAAGYHAAPAALADVQNAYYSAVQNLARVSYQAIIAATFVVFPLVSRSTFTDDKDTTRGYIEITVRYSLMFAMAIAVVMAASPFDVLGLLYAPDYAAHGGPALVWLAFGNVAFAMFAIAGTILNGAGRSRAAIGSAAITLAFAAVGNYIAISAAAGSGHVLEVAAMVTTSAMLLGAVITGWQLQQLFGASVPLRSLARIVISAIAAFAVGRVLPLHDRGKPMTLVLAVAVAVTFVGMLVATRELGARDLEAIKAVRRKRAPETESRGEP